MQDVRRELWRHRDSGKLWAVELMGCSVCGCYGPLDSGDLGLVLDGLRYERDFAFLRSFERRRGEFMARADRGEAA
jgi:hypothetical protein